MFRINAMATIMVMQYFRKQADRAEAEARAASDIEASEGLLGMALGYRHRVALKAEGHPSS